MAKKILVSNSGSYQEISAAIDDNGTITQATCNGLTDGAIATNPSGGTAPYTYDWSGPSGFTATTQNITNLGAGVYSLTISDAKGCTGNFTYNVTNNSAINATVFSSHEYMKRKLNSKIQNSSIKAMWSGAFAGSIVAWYILFFEN